MLAFDSNILIYALRADLEFRGKAFNVFYEIEQVGGICSSLIITETMYGDLVSIEQITPLQSPSIQIIPVSEKIAELAGQLKILHRLDNNDAVHIATALSGKATEFVTNDKKLLKTKVKGIKIRGL